jgi:hypothetical protein
MMITVQCGQLTLFRGSAVAEVDGFLFGQLPRRVFCFDAGPQLVQLSLLANLDVQLLLLGLHISSMHPHTHTHTQTCLPDARLEGGDLLLVLRGQIGGRIIGLLEFALALLRNCHGKY